MRFLQALRRSIKGEKDKQANVAITPKAAVAIVPPKKVIRALYDYDAQTPQELSFSRGDFFHVIGRENDQDWYEACNPALPDARGLVPVTFFQALGRTERDSAQSDPDQPPMPTKNPDHDSGYSETSTIQPAASQQSPVQAALGHRASKSGGKSGAMVYGIVMYDFAAERADELEAKAGEAIIVIAQSNPEWFVAKPIGRLGGPGLIPVSFVEIRDMASDKAIDNPSDAIKRAGVPKVEEWKKMAAEYKNSSITLGKFDNGAPPGQGGQAMEQGMERMSIQQHGRQSSQNGAAAQQGGQPNQPRTSQQAQQPQYTPKPSTQLLAPLQARIPRYCFAEEKYWFVIEAVLDDGRQWELSRYYEDFYDFQIALLTEFPAEAGNTGTQKRSLPYMPGPVNYVTDAITEGRLHNLDAYVKNLLNQPHYIARCNLVRQFFAPREGDYEIDANNNGEEYRLSQGSQHSSTDSPADGTSRQSSRNNLDAGGYAGLSAAPAPQNGNAGMSRQTSSLSQPSQTSLTPSMQQAQQQPASAMKIKMYYNGDLIAIRVPTDIQFQQLYDKIQDRLKVPDGDQLQLFYKDEPTGDKPSLLSDNDLDYALQRNEKLLLYVEIV
ncbi:bud emergence protein 1 [Neonectria punicea]|uniref:Bud emergence protein 1 n=1 Tax=Neonectria punicea TaxID=979145 RepID=A0ABR1H888_9HYPO